MIDELIRCAGADLAAMLYLGNDYLNPSHLPEPLQLTYWQHYVKSTTITGQFFALPIVRDGSMRLEVTVAIALQTPED